jgi:hypothetical protein
VSGVSICRIMLTCDAYFWQAPTADRAPPRAAIIVLTKDPRTSPSFRGGPVYHQKSRTGTPLLLLLFDFWLALITVSIT